MSRLVAYSVPYPTILPLADTAPMANETVKANALLLPEGENAGASYFLLYGLLFGLLGGLIMIVTWDMYQKSRDGEFQKEVKSLGKGIWFVLSPLNWCRIVYYAITATYRTIYIAFCSRSPRNSSASSGSVNCNETTSNDAPDLEKGLGNETTSVDSSSPTSNPMMDYLANGGR
jgi:hypothetical protein